MLINEVLVMASRLIGGRWEAQTAAIIDTQPVKTTESGGPRGYDAGKKINDRKRHIATDTQGNVLEARVHEASIQDRDDAPGVIESAKQSYSSLVKLFADGGYAGYKLASALSNIEDLTIETIKFPDTAKGFIMFHK